MGAIQLNFNLSLSILSHNKYYIYPNHRRNSTFTVDSSLY